jgi:cysteinyl-tRNA synthetase
MSFSADSEVQADEKKITDIKKSIDGFYAAMNDDLNTAVAFANLFNMVKYVNMLNLGQLTTAALGEEVFTELKSKFISFFEDVLGLKEELTEGSAVLDGMLNLYREYKQTRNYEKVDEIRSYFKKQGLAIHDTKIRIDWAYEE